MNRRYAISVLFVTILVSVSGNALVVPLLPFYAQQFGVDALAIGMLLGAFPLSQFLLSPYWGRLSDRIGRKPVIIASVLGTAASFVVVGLAESFWQLVVARLIGGAFGANIATAQAYVADLSPPDRRTKNLGLLAAAFGLGFVVGPMIGGLLGQVNLSVPAFFGAGLALTNAAAAAFFLPESRGPIRVATGFVLAPLRRRRVALPIAIFAIATLGSAGYQGVFPLYANVRLGFGPAEVGVVFALVGAVSIATQAFLVGLLSARLTEQRMALLGLSCLSVVALATPSVVVLTLASSGALGATLGVFVMMALITVSEGVFGPAATALVSRGAGDEQQGVVLGLSQSFASLARVIGPLVAGQLILLFGPDALFYGSGTIYAFAWLLALRARRVEQRRAAATTGIDVTEPRG